MIPNKVRFDLPIEIWVMILKRISLRGLRTLSNINHHWHTLIYNYFWVLSVTDIKLRDCESYASADFFLQAWFEEQPKVEDVLYPRLW